MDGDWLKDFGGDSLAAERSIQAYAAACAAMRQELLGARPSPAQVERWLNLMAIGAEGVARLLQRSLAEADDAARREINALGRKLQAASIALALRGKGATQ